MFEPLGRELVGGTPRRLCQTIFCTRLNKACDLHMIRGLEGNQQCFAFDLLSPSVDMRNPRAFLHTSKAPQPKYSIAQAPLSFWSSRFWSSRFSSTPPTPCGDLMIRTRVPMVDDSPNRYGLCRTTSHHWITPGALLYNHHQKFRRLLRR